MPLIQSSSTSLLIITTSTIAITSLFFLYRHLTTTTTTTIRRLDISFRLNRSRRIILLIQADTSLYHSNGTTRQMRVSVRVGDTSVEKEVYVMMVLLLFKWLMRNVVFEMGEELECGSVLYLRSLRLPVIAWAIEARGLDLDS